MKAILCRSFGPPRSLELAEIPDPTAGPGEVVVEVAVAGLNFFDILMIAGKYQTKPPFPFSPGGEVAGTIGSVGFGVHDLQPGDRVMGYTNFGAARERVAVDAARLVKLAPGLDFERGAALTITYGTAYYALENRAGLRAGETLVVLGAAGGVGLAAVELGRIMGARVIACASSDEKLAFARAHGADETINYKKDDLRDALRRAGGERGVDVVFDPVGGSFSEPAVRSLAWGGRHLVIGFAAGEIPRLPLNLMLLKSCAVIGVYWGAWARQASGEFRTALERVARWCAEGRLSAHVQAVYPLAETATALDALASRKVMGKLLVRPEE